MPYSKAEILDETIDRLELTVRTSTALKKRFGNTVLVRELAMIDEDGIRRMLKPYHGNPNIFVRDIAAALKAYGLEPGTSWSDMPPSRHRIVRNPRQMELHPSRR